MVCECGREFVLLRDDDARAFGRLVDEHILQHHIESNRRQAGARRSR
jgi:hypothetical protein